MLPGRSCIHAIFLSNQCHRAHYFYEEFYYKRNKLHQESIEVKLDR